MKFAHQIRFYGKANPLKKSSALQKVAVPQKQRLLSRKKQPSTEITGSRAHPTNEDIGRNLLRKTEPIDIVPDLHVENRFNLTKLNRQKGLNVVDIAKTWTTYQRRELTQRTKVEHEMAVSRDRAVMALEIISRKLAKISVLHEYDLPPTNRRLATLTRPSRLPFIY